MHQLARAVAGTPALRTVLDEIDGAWIAYRRELEARSANAVRVVESSRASACSR